MKTVSSTTFTAAIALPSANSFPALPVTSVPAVRRRSLLSVIHHRAGLLLVLTMLGSSASYCVYALGHMAP